MNMPTGVKVFRALLLSDVHIDSKGHVDRSHRKLLDAAKAAGAPIIKLGDTFDAMQGPHDKRADKGATKDEHNGADYFDRLVNTAADVYAPYAHLLAYIGTGNHETAVLKHSGTNLITRLCERLNMKHGAKVVPGGYRGWIKFQFNIRDSSRTAKNLYWCHGAGGGGEVSMGVLKFKRRQTYLPDADIVATGHIHEDVNARVARYRLSDQGFESSDSILHVSVPSLKDSQTGKAFSWEHEKEMPPKCDGAYWLTFTVASNESRATIIVPNAHRIIPAEL
ncbi:MAG: hypothetical protein KF805_12720 [Phycisphaeraceae bacterium]|nr:hypothetical protein [Phycisphaeraceae bacterium]